jgi:hypothetical protein
MQNEHSFGDGLGSIILPVNNLSRPLINCPIDEKYTPEEIVSSGV